MNENKRNSVGPSRPACTAAFLTVAAILAWVGTAHSLEFYWTNPAGGSFDSPGNWDQNDTPFTGDDTFFNLASATAYGVTLDAEFDIGSLEVMTDRVTLDLTHNLYLTDPSTGDMNSAPATWMTALMVGRGRWDPAVDMHGALELTGGGTLSTPAMVLGGASGSTGILTLRKAVGSSVAPSLTTTTTDTTIIGIRGRGELNVLEGASVSLGGFLMVSRQPPPSGQKNIVLVDGNGSSLTGGDMNIGHRGAAEMIVRNGGSVLSTNRVRVMPAGSTASLIIESGGTFTGNRFFEVGTGAGSNGIVEVRGQNSRLHITGQIGSSGASFGALYGSTSDTGTGMLTLEDGGEAQFNFDVKFWSRSSLNIDGGLLKAGTLDTVSGAEYNLTLHTGAYDTPVDVSGNVNLDNLDFTLFLANGFTADDDETFTILSYGGTLAGSFLGLAEDAIVSDADELYEFRLNYGSGSGDAITLTVIPEPATLGLLAGAFGLLALHRRRRAI